MNDLVSRSYLLAEYDRQHEGPPGRARKIIEDAPSVVPDINDGDMISRQTAIDGLKKTIFFRLKPDFAEHVKTYLESLPAAEQWHDDTLPEPYEGKP